MLFVITKAEATTARHTSTRAVATEDASNFFFLLFFSDKFIEHLLPLYKETLFRSLFLFILNLDNKTKKKLSDTIQCSMQYFIYCTVKSLLNRIARDGTFSANKILLKVWCWGFPPFERSFPFMENWNLSKNKDVSHSIDVLLCTFLHGF